MSSKTVKTNAMRILDRLKIKYETMTYTVDESDLSGEHAAALLGINPDNMFKTLLLKGDKTGYIVACIPVMKTLDLKALSKASGNKSAEMVHVKELFGITGYVRGGCSPIGMKKLFPTYIDESAFLFDKIIFSAGQRGVQIIAEPSCLVTAVKAVPCKITSEN